MPGDTAFLWGAGLGLLGGTGGMVLAMLKLPRFRGFILGLKFKGRPLLKLGKVILLALAFTACTPADGSEPPKSPGFELGAVAAVGPSVAVIITWRPGTTDSLTFIADTSGVVAASKGGFAPFSGVDTLVLGLRPAPGMTITWDVRAAYWWTNFQTATFGTAALGSVSYTEPQPGTQPGFDSLPPPDTTGAGPSASILELEIWPDSVTVALGEAIQFCALARLSNDPAKWVALPGVLPAPAVCVLAAESRNPPTGGGSVG